MLCYVYNDEDAMENNKRIRVQKCLRFASYDYTFILHVLFYTLEYFKHRLCSLTITDLDIKYLPILFLKQTL